MDRQSHREAGVSLVELLIYMLLSVVVLTIIGAILINSLRAESIVRTAANSTSTAQIASQSLNRGIHNASAIQVASPLPDVSVVRTRSIDGSATGVWKCQAWAVIAGELRTTTSDTAITVPTTVADIANWLLLAEGVKAIDATPVFELASDERSLSLSFTVGKASGTPVTVDTTIISKQPIPSTGKVTTPCF